MRWCSCFWIHHLDMRHCLTGTYQLSFTYCLEPWPSVPCWLWLEAGALSSSHVVLVMPVVQPQWFLLVQALILHLMSAHSPRNLSQFPD